MVGPLGTADYQRIDAPDRMLRGGIRNVGLGVLLGLSNPIYDLIALFLQVKHLQKNHWKSGISISFPRLRPELGGFAAEFPVDEKKLAQFIFAFRIVLPDAALSLSTRESAAFRNGMMGLGPTKMSANSKTTVGGYSDDVEYSEGQFDVNDERSAEQMCADLRARGFEPVSKTGIWRIGIKIKIRPMNSSQLERYSRHIRLPEIGKNGQQKLLDGKVLIVGAGGLGSPIALYLVAAGVGTVGIIDGDCVDLSNLQRQILHGTENIGIAKVESARETLEKINTDSKIVTYKTHLSAENGELIISEYDFVIDEPIIFRQISN